MRVLELRHEFHEFTGFQGREDGLGVLVKKSRAKLGIGFQVAAPLQNAIDGGGFHGELFFHTRQPAGGIFFVDEAGIAR